METNDIFSNLMNYSSNKENSSKTNTTKKMKKSDLLLENIRQHGFNMEQLEEVIRTKGNQLIISIAGSGKTTSLIFKITYDSRTGELTKIVEVNGNQVRVLDKVWVCTFLKSGADELKSKLSMWQRKLGVMDISESITFSTLHAEFKRALTALGITTNIIDSSVNSKNLKKVCSKYSIDYEGRPLNSDMLKSLESAFTYTRNRLDDKKYVQDIYKELNIGPTIIDAMLREWKSMRKEVGCVDFEDLQEMLYEECIVKNNLDVINFLSKRYKYIYIDEFQDTSQIQYEILKLYASGANKIVAIGDDDQTIYSWRGSYNKIITEEFAKDFNPTISNLSVNYRCPSNILNAIKPSLEMNEDRFKKELNSYKKGGILRFGEYSNYKSMVEVLSDLIYEDIKNDMSVAVLCRVNSDGLLPALMLDKLGKFQYTISGDGMTLDSYIGRSVINIARLFTERSTLAVKNSLSQLTWDKYGIDNIMKVCKNNKVSFWEIPNEDLVYSCPSIAETLKMWKSWRQNLGDIEALKMVYDYYRSMVYIKDTQYNNVCRSVISSIMTVLELSRVSTIEDFLEELEEINERLKARKKKFNGSKVRIATVHEFKGKEADSVYVWNDSVDVFPHKDCDLNDDEQVEEERRVHYIACTRARKINTIMCMRNKKGMFVEEMDLSKAEKLKTKCSGSLKKEINSTDDLDDIFEDEDYHIAVDFSKIKTSDEVKKDIYELSKEDKDFIIGEYLEGKGSSEIFSELKSNGLDNFTVLDIDEVISDFEKSRWG